MKHLHHISLTVLAFLALTATAFLTACDEVSPEDRLIYVKPAVAARSVLLVDFTGQACVNCPNGAQVIHQLEEQYGADTLIAVAMYSGPFGRSAKGTLYPLTTEQGNAYFDQWKLSAQPVAVIDYTVTSQLYTEWPTIVREHISQPATLRLSISEADCSGEDLTVKLSAYGTDSTTVGLLQLWLLEDSIVGLQVRHEPLNDMNSSITDKEYVHRHVFRKAINGAQGETFGIQEAEEKTLTFSTKVDAAWQKKQLSVVAFVYNDQGVQQATRKQVTVSE